MMNAVRFIPVAMLAIGGMMLAAKPDAVSMPLRSPLTALPATLDGRPSHDVEISAEEVRVSGTAAHLLREYGDTTAAAFSLYVGYHSAQSQANQMHSPRNCLPGAGWQVLTSGEAQVGAYRVNRYLIEFKKSQALVLYWYQGRGRVTANEFRVKMNLFSDASNSGRTEEALVRLVFPLGGQRAGSADTTGLTQESAEALGTKIAAQLIPLIDQVLPSPPTKSTQDSKTVASVSSIR